MSLHLLKLCVGATSIADLESWIALRLRRGAMTEQFHTTRMMPKRADELLDGGSLFWVIKGQIFVRQRLRAIRPFTDTEGIGRCDLVLEPVLHAVCPAPCRPFQGWRYLKACDAPRDLADPLADSLANASTLPENLRRDLRELGLL